MKNEALIDLFDRYHFLRMTEQEREQFETQLITDTSLAEEYDIYQQLLAGLKKADRQRSIAFLTEIKTGLNDAGLFLSPEEIDSYLLKKAPKDIQNKIEKRLQEDSKFKKQIDTDAELIAGLKAFQEEKNKNVIAAVKAELQQEGFFEIQAPKKKEYKIAPKRRQWAIAASIAIVTVLAAWLWRINTAIPNLPIAQFEWELEEAKAVANKKGFTGNVASLLTQSLTAIENNNLQAVRPTLDKISLELSANSSSQKIVQFLNAQLDVKEGRTRQGVKQLKRLSKDKDFIAQPTASWLLGRSYWQLGCYKLAKKQLLPLINNPQYSERAQRILETIE